MVLLAGTVIAWGTHWTGMASPVSSLTDTGLRLGVHLPGAYGFEALGAIGEMFSYAAIILPMGLINVVGSMQAIESAAAAGDDFPPKQTLAVNGLGTVGAGMLGSPFPTTLYIGHLGMKQMGARAGYSWMTGVVMAALCFSGSLGLLSQFIPIEAGMAILIWIGFTIGAQAFQAVPRVHAPAVIAGLIPGIGAFAALIVKRVLGSLGYGSEELPYSTEVFEVLTEKGLFAEGLFALEQGWLYCSIVLTSVMAAVIDQRFKAIVGWLVAGAGLAAVGIINNFEILPTDITTQLGPAWQWVFGYLLAVALLYLVKLVFVKDYDKPHAPGPAFDQGSEEDSTKR